MMMLTEATKPVWILSITRPWVPIAVSNLTQSFKVLPDSSFLCYFLLNKYNLKSCVKMWKWLLCLTFCLSEFVNSYKILVVFPMPARSHKILGDGFVRLLLADGHEVCKLWSVHLHLLLSKLLMVLNIWYS